MPDLQAFIDRWKASRASERANFQLFIAELCDELGLPHPEPATDVTAHNDYVFERNVTFSEGDGQASTGRIDLYRRDGFVMEGKQGSDAALLTEAEQLKGSRHKRKMGTARRGTRAWEQAMERAKNQALGYARSLPSDHGWPPFLVVVDVGYCFDLYADFARQGKAYTPFPDARRFRLLLDDLVQEDVRETLRLLWTDPQALDPARRSARVTRHLAERLALLAASLETAGHDAGAVAHFLMRCLFTMFAEDVGLLPARSFTGLLERYRHPDKVDLFPKAVRALWQTMDTGGFSPGLEAELPRFNGHLFREAEALPVSEAGLDLLIEAAQADWADVEPAIFGTLLERALDPRERHKLGAHFTPRAYVERLVIPTVVEPLRAEWTATQAAALAREAGGDDKGAAEEIRAFHRRLCSVRVLDPACGSGNFLYVALEHMKRLEGEVLNVLGGYTGGQMLLGTAEAAHDMTEGRTVTPRQFLGLEINPRAAAIAEVVLWIGYLQWHLRTYGDTSSLSEPILRDYATIREQDAVLAYDERIPCLDADGKLVTHWDGQTTKRHPVTGEEVPDETAQVPVYDYTHPFAAEWPEAEFIVGNPPFIGTAKMREALGDGYTEALRRTYSEVPNSADFVMYWWHKAALAVREGEAERFGFIATNSLRQTFNRRVLENHMGGKPPLSLVFAIPDHPWVDAGLGAAVRISMTVGQAGEQEGRLQRVTTEEKTDELGRNVRLDEYDGKIQPDLTVGADVSSAVPLKANKDISSTGVKLHGAGFIVKPDEAEALGLGRIGGLEDYIRPYRHGRDITQRPRGVWVIDLDGLQEKEVRDRFPEVYQWVYERVKPERDHNRERYRRENWWLFGRPNTKLRASLVGLPRYIATSETAKHRFFVFLDESIRPDNMLVNVAVDDAYFLGVLSSRIHVTWALAAGGRLGVGNDPRYNKTRCFETFPFPDASETQKEQIRTIAESLDTHRKRQLDGHDKLTITDMYNVLEKLRTGEQIKGKDKTIYDQGLVGVLKSLHDDLDAAVANAYGWPADLPDDAILERLVALNHERAVEEAQGFVRYLRPKYQNPEGSRQAALDVGAEPKQKAAGKAAREPWPETLPERIQAVQRALASEDRPADAEVIARRFVRAQKKQVQTLLETLETLGHIRQTDDGRFVV